MILKQLEIHCHMRTHIQKTYDFSYTLFSHIIKTVNNIYQVTSIKT